MAVCSMTGYASSDGICHDVAWVWELRSVNGKGLDVRIRMPQGFEALEQTLRQDCSDVLTRGNLQISLSIKEQGQSSELVFNEAALESVVKLSQQLSERFDVTKASVDGILNIRGVMEEQKIERSAQVQQELVDAVQTGFKDALTWLVQARQSEGAALADVLRGQFKQIAELVQKVIADPSRSQDAIKLKLKTQVQSLLEAHSGFDDERLYTEAAILATKADLQEEIDRLLAHIDAANALLNEGGPIGRRLDFLAQEFNRETNTVCSKSNAASVTEIGLDLKILIDQFREQIQNVE
jgi:uncharacterized protein (TIGR00255 family)